MKYAIALLLVLVSPVLGADAPPVPGPKDIKKEVDSLVSELPTLKVHSVGTSFAIPGSGPMYELISMGIRAVPYLIPHLSDKRLTESWRGHGKEKRQITVNELVGSIITTSCGHIFYIASGDRIISSLGVAHLTDDEQIKLYQEQVHKWYRMCLGWHEAERRIKDINDWFQFNRFGAYDFFKRTGDLRGREHLERRVDFLNSDRPFTSTTQSEMVSCMEALASIGDEQSIPVLRSAWQRLYGRPAHASLSVTKLFTAYKARVKIGDGEQALQDLEVYKERYYSQLDAFWKKKFDEKYKEVTQDSDGSKPSDE